MIREATAGDAQAIADIYNHYIHETVVTFEEQALTAAEIVARLKKVREAGLVWLVAEQVDGVIGYAYATEWRERAAYRHTVEVSVYLANTVLAKGWGTKLYEALFTELNNKPVHMVIGGITLPNPASVALHEKFGMEKVAHFRQVGYKFGQWLDVGYWQMPLAG